MLCALLLPALPLALAPSALMDANKNVFIAGLPDGMDDGALAALFGEYGTVVWSKMMNPNGKPGTAAIVEFGDIAEAKWVVENLDGNIPQGLTEPVKCNFKKDRRSDKGDKGYGKGDDGWGKGKGGGYGAMGGKGYSPAGKGKGFTPYGGGKAYGGGK